MLGINVNKGRQRAREESWEQIGRGAENTADFIIKKLNELDKDKAV